MPQLVVQDTLLDGLWALARAARTRFKGPVIGLTGSAGKTSTKEFLAAYPRAYASPSSFNNFWGVPLTLCNADPNATVWVVEMGMNQAGEISRLSQLTAPTVATVINVQPVHLEKLGSLEAIRREKISIVHGLAEDGALVLPAGIEAPEWKGRIIRFGDGVRGARTASCGYWRELAGVCRCVRQSDSNLPWRPERRIGCRMRWRRLHAIHAAGLRAIQAGERTWDAWAS